jgi:hypothetical protein
MISRAIIVQSPLSNPRAVEKAIVMLYDWQTSDEQSARDTKHTNGRGFNTAHAKLGTYYAKWIKSGKNLTGHHLGKARTIALYYAGTQLLEAAKLKAKIKSSRSYTTAQAIEASDPFQKTVGVSFLAE